jgi:hypothetical protein
VPDDFNPDLTSTVCLIPDVIVIVCVVCESEVQPAANSAIPARMTADLMSGVPRWMRPKSASAWTLATTRKPCRFAVLSPAHPHLDVRVDEPPAERTRIVAKDLVGLAEKRPHLRGRHPVAGAGDHSAGGDEIER